MTPDANDRHIETLRAKSRDERARVAALNAKLGDLKKLLEPASSQLDFVDYFFLDAKILSEDRTPKALAYWLKGADTALKMAVDTREYVDGLVAKFGPDARMFG